MEGRSKRMCTIPYKKWTESEVQKLLFFLKENRPIEKPTAQAYYRRFMVENGVDSEWKHVRCKVRSMRQAYINAKTMLNSNGTGTIKEGETLESVILKKYPMFFEFEDVFGYQDGTFIANIVDSSSEDFHNSQTSSAVMISSSVDQIKSEIDSHFDEESNSTIQSHSEVENKATSVDSGHQSSSTLLDTKRPTKCVRKGIYSRTGLADVLQVQSEILAIRKNNKEAEVKLKEEELKLQKEKLSFEKEKQAKEYDLQEQMFLFEKEKLETETRRIDKQLRMERKLRIMEMKIKREIGLKEIEMKERVEMEKLKKGQNIN